MTGHRPEVLNKSELAKYRDTQNTVGYFAENQVSPTNNESNDTEGEHHQFRNDTYLPQSLSKTKFKPVLKSKTYLNTSLQDFVYPINVEGIGMENYMRTTETVHMIPEDVVLPQPDQNLINSRFAQATSS